MATREDEVGKEVVSISVRGRHPYFKFLKTKFNLPTIDSFTDTTEAQHLQSLLDAGETVEYEKQKYQYEQAGHTFRLTDMVLYETFPTDRTIEVKIAIQVKAHSITWYFWVPGGKDQYPQDFRDILYKSAGEAHQRTTRGCDLYYRGSNAFHVKTMHTKEEEASHNHNHYRMKDNLPVRPEDFAEHMMAMKGTEAYAKHFFVEDEIEEIIEDFNTHYRMWTYKGPDGTEKSPEEIYMAKPQNKINEADVIEFKMFGEQQEPCRINVTELQIDFDKARRIIEDRFVVKESGVAMSEEAALEMTREIDKLSKQFNALMAFRKIGGSRGLGSERAMTRQVEGSKLPEIPVVASKDDSIGETPPIPMWARHALLEVEKARNEIEKMAKKEEPSDKEGALVRHGMFKTPVSISEVYLAVPEVLKTQLDKIFMQNAVPIKVGNFQQALRDLRRLYLEYHPDKHNQEVQPGFHELQKIIEKLRDPHNSMKQTEVLAILDKMDEKRPEDTGTSQKPTGI